HHCAFRKRRGRSCSAQHGDLRRNSQPRRATSLGSIGNAPSRFRAKWRSRIRAFVAVVTLAISLAACKDTVRRRPYGYLKLGPVEKFLAPETFLASHRLLIRVDDRGLYVMSTECTYDLSPLDLVPAEGAAQQRHLASRYTTSTYDM